MSLPPFIENLPPELTLLGIFAFTMIYSFSMPITEEIALVLVGILAHARGFPFPIVFLCSYPGIFGSDLVYYGVARKFGFRILSSKFLRRFINPRRILASETYFRRRGPRIAFFCRFIVGIRAPVMIAAGFLRMPFRVYAFWDGLSAVFATTIWLTAGYFFGNALQNGMSSIMLVISILTPICLVLGTLFINHKIACEERRLVAQMDPEELDRQLLATDEAKIVG